MPPFLQMLCLVLATDRALHQGDLHQMDVTFRQLFRTVVGPPAGIDGSSDWHVILHLWNDRVHRFANFFHIKTWSRRCMEHCWELGGYVANLPQERWIHRVLAWNPLGCRCSGRRASDRLAGSISKKSKERLHHHQRITHQVPPCSSRSRNILALAVYLLFSPK